MASFNDRFCVTRRITRTSVPQGNRFLRKLSMYLESLPRPQTVNSIIPKFRTQGERLVSGS